MPTVIQSDKLATSHLGAASTFGLQVPAYLAGYSFAAAYSLRQLRQLYAGPCLRVRNNTNNAEGDVAFYGYSVRTSSVVTITAAGTSGYSIGQTMTLATFASTNDVRVKTWYDQSGNGRDATQGTNGYQPALMTAGAFETENGLPIIVCDGTDDTLVATWSRPAVQTLVVAGVTPSDGNCCWLDGYNASGSSHGFFANLPGRTAHNGTSITEAAVSDVGVRRCYAARFNGASSYFFADGVQVATGDAGSRTSTNLLIGQQQNATFYTGQYWEVLEIDNATTDLATISQQVMAYYGTY